MILSLLVLLELSIDFSDLPPHVTRVNAVEDGDHGEGASVLEIHDLDDFFEAPSGRCVVRGDHHDGELGLLDGAV